MSSDSDNFGNQTGSGEDNEFSPDQDSVTSDPEFTTNPADSTPEPLPGQPMQREASSQSSKAVDLDSTNLSNTVDEEEETNTSRRTRLGWRETLGAGVVVIAALTMILVGLGGEGEEDDPNHVIVEMLDNRFVPKEIQIPVGGRVTFKGVGRNPHNAVAVDGSWSTEDVFGSLEQYEGDEATLVFDTPGRWPFYCTFHAPADGSSGMVGVLTVGDPESSASSQGVATSEAPSEWSGITRSVPEQYPNIQAAVDAATPGDLVLVGPGTYREQVTVATPGLTLRGTDRNTVIIDGEGERVNNIDVFADGVAIENMTLINARRNGVFWTGIRGYRASYLTAVDNGDYGIYAFDSSDGLFEHSYASGSPDSGFYIGQCDPCEAVITDVIAEWNGLGYSGTNSSTELYIINSTWRHNVAGIVPNTLDGELLPPVQNVTIMGNLVHDNDNRKAPVLNNQWSAYGNGILIAGGLGMRIEKNRVFNHAVSGISLTPNLDKNFWMSYDNQVRDNIVEGSGRADLTLAGPAGTGNCFSDNDFSHSLPAGLQVFQSCEGLRLPWLFELGGSTEQLGRVMENGLNLRPDPEVGSTPYPPSQPQLPGGADAPVSPAVDVFVSYPLDLQSIQIPSIPDGEEVDQERGVILFGVLLASVTSVFFGLFAYFLPFVLYAAWVTLALWDLARRQDIRRGQVVGWFALILLVPLIGVVVYHIVARSLIPGWQRLLFVGGGSLAYLIILVLGAVVGGVV